MADPPPPSPLSPLPPPPSPSPPLPPPPPPPPSPTSPDPSPPPPPAPFDPPPMPPPPPSPGPPPSPPPPPPSPPPATPPTVGKTECFNPPIITSESSCLATETFYRSYSEFDAFAACLNNTVNTGYNKPDSERCVCINVANNDENNSPDAGGYQKGPFVYTTKGPEDQGAGPGGPGAVEFYRRTGFTDKSGDEGDDDCNTDPYCSENDCSASGRRLQPLVSWDQRH